MATTTTWTKLRDGSWGLRGEGLVPGSRVTVTRKDGTTSTVTVGDVVWVGNAVGQDNLVLATVAKDAPKSAPRAAAPARRSRRGWRPCGYPGCSPEFCDECDGEGFYA